MTVEAQHKAINIKGDPMLEVIFDIPNSPAYYTRTDLSVRASSREPQGREDGDY